MNNFIAKVLNVPLAFDRGITPYVVTRAVDGDLWFYGAYNDIDKAHDVAVEIDGCVLKAELKEVSDGQIQHIDCNPVCLRVR